MAERTTSLERPAEQLSETMLIRRVRDGEHELFYELIRPYERRLYAAFKYIRQFRAEARFSTWLIQIAVNEARMRRRKAHANIMEPIDVPQGDEGNYTPRDFADWREIPSETLERNEIRKKLAEALAGLGQIYREVFVLRDMQQFTLGISAASVKTRLLRARLMLRDLLAPGLGGAWSTLSMTGRLSFEKGTKPW
jgi:RNA polymerase sigma-70 factor (ECF subfamily)